MANLVSADISAACSALGYFDAKANKYFADSNTLETVKDLIRYLRRDDDTFDIRRQLGASMVLQSDLLPMLKSYWEETDLFDVLLRLIVNLTTPALMLWNEEAPTDKTVRNFYLQVEDHLQAYKEAFADEAVWAVLSTRLSKILEIEYAQRGDENSLIIERILILIRNILYVAADTSENRPDNDASIHDQVLWALHQSGMLDIILYISSSPQEHAYYLHILEILSFMLREQKPSDLANAALQRSQTEKVQDEAALLAIRHRESQEKQKKTRNFGGIRHSRFGGTFVIKSMKSINDENDLIYHKPLNNLSALNFSVSKTNPKIPKNRLPIKAIPVERRSAFSIRLFLKEFCIEFINGSYNTIMRYVKDSLARGSQQNDSSYYLWALRFFMEFNRYYKFDIKLVSETMSVTIFYYVQQQSENFYDQIASDKKRLKLWGKRLHVALLAYKELFLTLSAMDKSTDSSVRDSSKVIKNNIFYVAEYREFILALLVNYDELKMSDKYLTDLIETQHVFLKMLEEFCKTEGTVIVQSKGRKKVRRGKSKKAPSKESRGPTKLDLDALWDEAGPQISVVLESITNFPTDVVPFDAASDVPIDEQKAEAMRKIQRKLRSSDYEEAIGLFHAAREVWPENDSFGSANMASEEEFLALRDIFCADLGENEVAPSHNHDDQSDQDGNNSELDEEEEGEEINYNESNFKFHDFAKRLAHPKIVRACGLALKQFDTNSVHTNHCIIKLLHRIAFDCKMYVMLFQLSIFRTFQKIYALKDCPEHKELIRFATYIIRQFIKVSETNKKVFIEALFWKSAGECYEIETGYKETGERSEAAQKMWSEEQEDEVRRLFMEHRESNQEQDVVDWILDNLIDTNRTRRGLLRKLKEMHLLTDYKGKKKSTGSRAPRNWSQDEEEQLKELFEQYKDTDDPMGFILENMETQRPKNRVLDKLMVMGLIQDKKDVRKKRSKKSNKSKSGPSNSDQESELSDNSSGDDIGSRPSTSNTKRINTHKKGKANKSTQRKKSHPKVSKRELVQLILDVMENEMHEALEWLKDSLSDAAEDYQEGGGEEAIPLVPVMDYAESAMENDVFLKMLKAFGCSAPFDEQETYWRISGQLTPETLKDHCDLIQQALDKTLALPQEEEHIINDDTNEANISQDNLRQESSDEEDVFSRIRMMQKPKSPENTREVYENGQVSDDNVSARSQTIDQETFNIKNLTKQGKNKNKLISDSAESSSHSFPESSQNTEETATSDLKINKNPKKSRIVRRVSLDSESDSETKEKNHEAEEIDAALETSVSNNEGKHVFDSDSDADINYQETSRSSMNKSKSKILYSDSDENSNEEKTLKARDKQEKEEILKRERSGSDSSMDKPVSKRSRILDSDED